MKVGILPWTLASQRTGLDNYLSSLVTNMVEIGKSSEIYEIRHEKTDARISEATKDILLPNLPKILKSPIGLPYAIKKADLDVFHASAHYFSQIAPFYLNFDTGRVLTIHDLIPLICPSTTDDKTFFWLWKTTLGNIFWQFILAITAISTVIKPTLKLGDKILQNTEVLTKWRMLDNQFQKLTISISQEKAYDEKSKREFGRLLDVKASIQEPTDKLDKSLRNECFGMVKKELPFENFFVPEE